MEGFRIQELFPSIGMDRIALAKFLACHSLRYEADIDAAFGIFDWEGTLVGCGCAAKDILKCFAADPSLRGQNALGVLVSALMQNRYAAGYYDLFVITRIHNEPLFQSCGLHTIARTDTLVMLENQADGPERFARGFILPNDPTENVGALVMNCNPFTLGHRYLVEQAAAQCDVLHLFVVEEDRSYFPAADRFRLVQEGTADLPNVRVHLSGHYIISAATFPKYFLKADEDATSLQSELDLRLFAESIAPSLHITKRFVGEEPLDAATARYNITMHRILPEYGIACIEIPRKTMNNEVISASHVRTLLRSPDTFPQALALVPPSTQEYLKQRQELYYEY